MRPSDHSSLRLRFRYYNQVQRAVGGVEATRFDNYTAGAYFVYEFDAYKL